MSTSDSTVTELGSAPAPQVAAEAPQRATARAQQRTVKDLSKADDSLSGKKIIITIPQTKDDTQKGPVFVGVNGTGYHIPRGIPCRVPIEVADTLDNAVEKVYDTGDGSHVIESEVPRINYQSRPAD